MKKLASRWWNIKSKPINYRIALLCKIFIIGLLLQFFLQTFVTFKLWRDGKFWTLFRMWKEFILLVFVIIVLRYTLSHLKEWITMIKNKEHIEQISRKIIRKNIKSEFIIQFLLIFSITLIIFFFLAIWIQHVWLWAFFLSFKYDMIWFFIFWIWICLALLFFSEKDKNILNLYEYLILTCIWWWLLWRFAVRLMPNALKLFGYNPQIYEWTVWQNPPAAYYTLINKWNVRNQFLFERPTSFGFWLIAFFPVFVLGYLRKKNWNEQILPVLFFWLLILSTRSRAWMVVRALEAIILFFIIYRKNVKKHFTRICIFFAICLWCLAYLWRWIMVREHSNTGHLVLMQAWLNLAKNNLALWRWAWYAWPASHQLCFTDEPIDVYADIESINLDNPRCQTIRKINLEYQISTYWFNPENQYLQIFIEYGLIWTIFRILLCIMIIRYTRKNIIKYHKRVKSPYQEYLYYCLIWFEIWFVWLCIEWLVLHSLVDRMIVYPFFLLYGVTLWLREKEKNKTYIPPILPQKKKKKSKSKHKK